MVEALVGVFILIVAVVGSASAIKAMRKSETSSQERMGTAISVAEARAFTSRVMANLWVRLAQKSCTDPGPLADLGKQYMEPENFTLLDKAALETQLTPELRHDIEQVMARGGSAFVACSSEETLKDPNLKTLKSVYHQGLCRCAVARTAYETLNPAETDHAKRTGLYGCVKENAETGTGRLIEMTAYVVDVSQANRVACRDMASLTEEATLERVDYTVSEEGPSGSFSGTFYIPLGGTR